MSDHIESPLPDDAVRAARTLHAWCQAHDPEDADVLRMLTMPAPGSPGADSVTVGDVIDAAAKLDDDVHDDTGDSYRGEPAPRPGKPVTIAEITTADGDSVRRYVSAPGGPLMLHRGNLGRWRPLGMKPLKLTADDDGRRIALADGALLTVSVITADMLDDVAADGDDYHPAQAARETLGRRRRTDDAVTAIKKGCAGHLSAAAVDALTWRVKRIEQPDLPPPITDPAAARRYAVRP